MKKLLLFLGVILIFSCSKDDPPAEPSVETIDAILLEDGGVRLVGKISNLRVNVKYGFLLSYYRGGIINMDTGIVKKDVGKVDGEYSFEIRNDLLEGKTYFFSAFFEYDGKIIMGEEMSFVSNGSAPPVIKEITPSIAHVGDTITVEGENFSNELIVYFNDRKAKVLPESENLFKTIVPFDSSRDEPYSNLSIHNPTGETTVFEGFSMYTPVINSVAPYAAHEKDTITIIGDHFNLINEQNRLTMEVFGNYYNLEIVKSSRTEIKFVNNGWFYDLYPKMKLKSQFQTLDFDDKFQAKLPTITDTPDCISYGKTATIYGKDFPRVGNNFSQQFELKIGGVSFSAASISRDSIVLNIHDEFYPDFTLKDVVIQYLGETITYETEICINEPWLKVGFDNPLHPLHKYQDETYGLISDHNGSLTVGKFNSGTNKFESVLNQALPQAVRYGLRAWDKDKMYSYDISPNVNKFSSYNFLNGNLEELTPFPGAQRINGIMTRVGDYIYLGLGRNKDYDPFDDLWRYSIPDDSWEMILTYPGIKTYEDAINDPLIFAFEDRLFFEGRSTNEQSGLFWEIDLTSFALIPRSNIPYTNSKSLKGATMGSKGYFESGYLFEYDLNSDQWITHEEIEGTGYVYDSGGSLFTHNGTIYRSVSTTTPYYNLLFKMNMSFLD
ncbi:IPT/TIG domain-containing protein [Salinimicrobium soli]|uniref:IPT/TIG domain-containing protein n=1 Tax=Salinimicrobium soli TaxID=1254399 RepID=UPI003AAC089F